jgi:hypothetical protein
MEKVHVNRKRFDTESNVIDRVESKRSAEGMYKGGFPPVAGCRNRLQHTEAARKVEARVCRYDEGRGRVARASMQAYVQKSLDEHVREHEKKGVTLNLRKAKASNPLPVLLPIHVRLCSWSIVSRIHFKTHA